MLKESACHQLEIAEKNRKLILLQKEEQEKAKVKAVADDEQIMQDVARWSQRRLSQQMSFETGVFSDCSGDRHSGGLESLGVSPDPNGIPENEEMNEFFPTTSSANKTNSHSTLQSYCPVSRRSSFTPPNHNVIGGIKPKLSSSSYSGVRPESAKRFLHRQPSVEIQEITSSNQV